MDFLNFITWLQPCIKKNNNNFGIFTPFARSKKPVFFPN